ncbi:helix-turn-helix transcriptional regulator [Candidatus Dojkabacteria bacterium]|nr:helix-turn-helix transcriptional regulator [Candidatus Dojkabacteria bacterium]
MPQKVEIEAFIIRKKIITENKIIESAAEVINQKGLENFNIENIAKNAGIAKGSIYLYFRSKKKLLKKTISLFIQQRIQNIEENINQILQQACLELKIKKLVEIDNRFTARKFLLFKLYYALLIGCEKDIKASTGRNSTKTLMKFITETSKKIAKYSNKASEKVKEISRTNTKKIAEEIIERIQNQDMSKLTKSL